MSKAVEISPTTRHEGHSKLVLKVNDDGIVERGATPILVGGSYIDLMKAWNTPVYYDQEGTLVRKLGITGVPAIVSQEGSRLRIDEVTVR